ncbi:MAG: NUDIX hydrolase, partial [Vicinamibacteria bacterium]|nr:NUDIX hydrolase [Vicinamibacteria bacterium]
MRPLLAVLATATLAAHASGQAPAAEWDLAKARAILDQTAELRLDPDLASLTPGERVAVAKLLAAGQRMQAMYEAQRHPQALAAKAALDGRHAAQPSDLTRALRDLYRLNNGPIAVTLDNRREPFLAVAPQAPERNVYPKGATVEAIEAAAKAHPDRRAALFDTRSVVRRADAAALAQDKAALRRHPVLDALHPGLRARLEAMAPDASFYAVPQAVAHADELVAVHGLLHEAAVALEADDPEFASYLRHRGRDLLANDYEAGDASWVNGRFRTLNAQIGSYETYDDALFGQKAFFSFSLLKKDAERSTAVERAVAGLQQIQDALPAPPRRVREQIPVGVYDVIADFGQARGTNTASILPNEAL